MSFELIHNMDDNTSKTSNMTALLFKQLSSSTSSEQPLNQWLSLQCLLEPPVNDLKSVLYEQGLYDPGSGEICVKHIKLSDSEVYRHVYYNYPSIKDPGIEAALLKSEPMKKYPGDGQELYLDLCKEMGIAPVRSFYRGLFDREINLKYYGLNPIGIRLICLALTNNKYVRRLDLTDNRLDHDACFHLGQLLGESFALQELVLAGCKMGPEGLLRLLNRMNREPLELLNLSNNNIGDDGLLYLTYKIKMGAIIYRLNLSHNDLNSKSGLALAEAFEYNSTVTHLDLSWNKIFLPRGANDLFGVLSESYVLTELNFSWNGLTTSATLPDVICAPNLKVLDLSNNRLSTDTIKPIAAKLHRGKSLQTLDLSYNLMNSSDAMKMLKKMTNPKVKLRNLYMKDIPVTKEFKSLLTEVLSLSFRKKITTITHGKVLRDYSLLTPDLKEIVMKRLDYITRTSKKCHIDIGVFFVQCRETKQFMEVREMQSNMKLASVPVGEELMEQFVSCFPGPKTPKGDKCINLERVVDYVRRLWPEKVTPIPLQPPVVLKMPVKPIKPAVAMSKKDKKKKKK